MTQILKQSTAVDVLIGPFVDSTDGYTAETGVSPSVKLSKNGQALAAKNDVTTPVSDADGYYNCELDATDTNTLGTLVLSVVGSATSLPVRHEYMVVPANAYDALVGGSDTLQADVTQISGSNVSTSTAQLGVNAVQAGGTAWGSGAITAGAIATDAITAAKIATDAIGSDELAASAVSEIQSGLATSAALATVDTNVDAILVDTGTTLPATLGTPAGADLATDIAAVKTTSDAIETDTQDIQSRLPAALVSGRMSSDAVAISGSTGAADKLEANMTACISGTVTGTPTSTEVAATGLTALTGGDDVLIGRILLFTSGNAIYEAARITDYVDSTGAMTVTELAVTPAASDTFVIV